MIELETVKPQSMTVEEPENNQHITRRPSRREIQLSNLDDGPDGILPSPTTTGEQLERWNRPRINIYRTMATFLGFAIMYVVDPNPPGVDLQLQ